MRHRGKTQTISFRLSGKSLDELERQAKDFGLSLGEMSRAVVDRHLKNEEFKSILGAIEALASHHQQLTESTLSSLAEARSELKTLRIDFNRAVGRADDVA